MINNIRQGLLATLLLLLCAGATWAAENNVAPLKLTNVFIAPDGDSFTVQVVNYGSAEVTSLGYSLLDTDKSATVGEGTVTLDEPLQSGDAGKVSIPVKPDTTRKAQNLCLFINTVNGKPNETTYNYTYLTLYTVSHMPHKRILVEDYTGLWCGYCTRGTVTMEYLERLHPDDFVGVTIHCRNGQYDPMDVNAYGSTRTRWANSFPTMMVNRKTKIVNWVEGVPTFTSEMQEPAVADIDAEAVWQKDGNGIDITATVTPVVGADSGRYGVAYVLIEDGMSNPGWAQSNFLDQWEGDNSAPEEADKFRYSSYIYGLTYDHVAIASLGIDTGVEGSLDRPLAAEVAQTHEASFTDIAQYGIIQSKDSLHVVAMLIDRQTRQVENVVRCDIKDQTVTAISGLADKSRRGEGTAPAYNLSGQRVGAGYRGIVISEGKKLLRK